jgi:hypothetical protein
MADPIPPAPPPAVPRWKVLLGTYGPWLLSVAFAALAGYLGLKPIPVPPPPLPVVGQARDDDATRPMGWINDPAQVAAVKATMARPLFSQTPAGAMPDPLPDHVFGWAGYVKLFGHAPPEHDQGSIGSCVSFGSSRAMEQTLANEIAFGGGAFEYHDFSEEVIYAGSRVTIGGGQLRGEDGSLGAWAAKFATQDGGLPKAVYGKYDLTGYSQSRCRSWGNAGVPADLMPEVKKYPTGDAALVQTWADAKKALAQGYMIAECSDVLFGQQRDANGVAQPSRQRGGHCQCLDGYCVIGGKEYGHVTNSWGANYHKGPTGPGSPNSAGYWADAKVVARMLAQGDSWAFSGVKGFPAKKPLDWIIRAGPPRPRFDLRAFALLPTSANNER